MQIANGDKPPFLSRPRRKHKCVRDSPPCQSHFRLRTIRTLASPACIKRFPPHHPHFTIRRTCTNPNLNGQFFVVLITDLRRENYRARCSTNRFIVPLLITCNNRNNPGLSTYPGLGIKSWHRSAFAAVISRSCNLAS